MKQWLVLFSLLVVSCVSDPMGLTVKQYHLREKMFDQNDDLMARGEVQRLLHGAVTIEERQQKAGQYYHAIWKQSTPSDQPIEVAFEYLQAGTGSKIKRLVQSGSSTKRFDAYFTIAGNDYLQNGRVLAWRTTVRSGGTIVASKQSYMWR